MKNPLNRAWWTGGLLTWACLTASTLHAKDPTVLFVGGQPDAAQGADPAVMEKLQEWYGEDNVTYVDSGSSTTEDAEGKDLVVVSSTPGSGSIRTKFRDVAAGVVNWEEALVDVPRDGNFPFVNGGRPKSQHTDWVITDTEHFITKDFAGQNYTLWDPAAETWSGVDVVEGVQVLATDPDETGATLMVVDEGVEIDGGYVAAGRRVMLGMTDGTADSFTDEGWELFKRALDWAAKCDGTTLTEGLIGYWSFNDLKVGSSEAVDASANSNIGVVNGEPTLVEGPAGEGDVAISFDGIDDSVTTEGAIMNDIDEFTMAGWVKFPQQGGNRIGLFGQNDAIEFGMINPTTMQHWSAAGGAFDVPFGPVVEEWTSIVLVNTPDQRTLYVNGEEEATGGGTNPANSGFTFNMGGDGVYDATGNFFTGEMDDVAVWNRALSAAEVFELFTRRAVLPPDVRDTDGDGMGDQYETDNGLDPNDAGDRDLDNDGDTLTNFEEFERRTDPNNEDSDGDGLNDNVETDTGTWVSADDTGTHPLKPDTDKDQLLDGAETNTGTFVSAEDAGTDPHNPDTDGDGAKDGLEVTGGTDPHDQFDLISAIFGGAPFTTTHVHSLGDQIGDVDSAKAATAGETDAETLTVDTPYIHFHDNANAPIFQDLSRAYPLWDPEYVEGATGPNAPARDDFAIYSRGEIFVRRSGETTFVVNSDDGFSLEIDGEEIGNAGNRGRGNTFMTVDLEEGVHTVDFWHWERGGGAGVSVYIYRGVGEAPASLNDGDFELLQSFNIFEIVTQDSDGDGMDDFAEQFFFDGLDRDGTGDFDEDGLSDAQELELLAFPNNKDSDGDGLEDGPEVSEHNTNPASSDTDGDSLADGQEINDLGTDPTNADTDGDTFADNVELSLGNDPLQAGDKPDAIIAVTNGSWSDPTTWSDGLAPSAGKRYVAVGTVTNSLTSSIGPFAGDSLTLIGPEMTLNLDHEGEAAGNFRLDNAGISLVGDAALGGSLDIRGEVLIDVGSNSLTLNSQLSGGGHLTLQGGTIDEAQGSVEVNGEGHSFAGPIDIIGTDLAGLGQGSLGSGSILLAGGGVAYGYDYDSDVSLLKIQGDNFRLVLAGAVKVADVIGVDPDGGIIFSLNDLAGPGPYTADDLLGAFSLDDGISGAGTIELVGTAADSDGDGLRDSWENENFGNLDSDGTGDPDGDGLTNLAEQGGGTNPNEADPDPFGGGGPVGPFDVTSPDDAIALVNGVNDDDGNDGPPPGAEGVENVINNIGQKYLNFLDLGSGFVVTPGVGATTVTGLRFYPANDAVERDPASFVLEGSPSGADGPWVYIANGDLALPDARNGGGDLAIEPTLPNQTVFFANPSAYVAYRVTFPTVKDAAAANSMQIAEVELLGTEGGTLGEVTVPLVHYDFNEGEGTTIGNAGSGEDGELVNAAADAWQEGSPDGTAYLKFDDENGGEAAMHITTGIAMESLTDYTMTAWVNFDNNVGDNMVFGQKVDENVLHNGARDAAYYQAHWGNDHAAGTLDVGNWHHVAYRYENGVQSIHVDGEQISEEERGPVTSLAEIVIGTTRAGDDRDFSGGLDDVRIYDAALPDFTIAQIAAGGDAGGGDGGGGDGGGGDGDRPGDIGAITKSAALLSLTLPAGATFDVEYSTDLENWTVIAADVTGTFEDNDAARNAEPGGFYRAVAK